MKKFFEKGVRKLSASSSGANFNLRRLSLNSSSSVPQIRVLRGGYNIDLQKVDATFTKLHKAAYLNNEERVRKYLGLVNSVDNYGRTALHLAAVNGNLKIVRLLLHAGAKVNVQDEDGKSPIIKAVECGHNELVPELLQSGSDVDLADKDKGNTVLHHCLLNGNLDAALYIIRHAMEIDYNKRNHRRETFLHLAAKVVDLYPVIEELIASGIEIEAVDEMGRTAARVAQQHNNHEANRLITRYAKAKHRQVVISDEDACYPLAEDISDLAKPTSRTSFHSNGGEVLNKEPVLYGNLDQLSESSSASSSHGFLNGIATVPQSQSKLSGDSFGSSGRPNSFDEKVLHENVTRKISPSPSNATTASATSQSHSNPAQIKCDATDAKVKKTIETTYLNINGKSPTVNKDLSLQEEEEENDELTDLDELLQQDLNPHFDLQVSKPKNNASWLDLIDPAPEHNEKHESHSIETLLVVGGVSRGDEKPKDVNLTNEVKIDVNGRDILKLKVNESSSVQDNAFFHQERSPSSGSESSKPKSYAEVAASPRRADSIRQPVNQNQKNIVNGNSPLLQRQPNQRATRYQPNSSNSPKKYHSQNANGRIKQQPSFNRAKGKMNSHKVLNNGFHWNPTQERITHNSVPHSPIESSNNQGPDKNVQLRTSEDKGVQVLCPEVETQAQLIQSIKRIVLENSGAEHSNSDYEKETTLLTTLTSLVHQSKQTKSELELKSKELVLLKHSMNQLQKQMEQEQKYCAQLETKLAQITQPIERGVSEVNNHINHDTTTLVNFLKDQYSLKTKHYDATLNEVFNENFALKRQCCFLQDKIRSLEGRVSGNETAGAMTNSHQLASLLGKFDEKLSYLSEVSQQRVQANEEESRQRSQFMRSFRQEVSALKRMMAQAFGDINANQPVMPASKEAKSKSNLKAVSRKSYSLHDLVTLDHSWPDERTIENQPEINGEENVELTSYVTAQLNANLDHASSFSYKSKYFQSKINELRKQLGYAN